MSGRFFVTNTAVEDWLLAQNTVAPVGSETWKHHERQLIDLVNLAAERKEPKQDGGQLVYKIGRDLLKEATSADHPLAKWDGASLEIYLHVSRDQQLLAVRRRGRTSSKQGGQ